MATAGDKSLYPYRIGVGVTGYTGFIPASENIGIPVKRGSCLRAPLERGNGAHGDGGTITRAKTTFTEAHSLTPEQFKVGTTPNSLWDLKVQRPVGDPPFVQRPVDPMEGKRPFYGTSTSRESYDKGLGQAEYPDNVTRTGRIRPPGARVAEKKDPFYTTEYTWVTDNTADLLAAKQYIPPPQPEPPQLANKGVYSGVALHPELPRTSYRDAFGAYGVNPSDNLPQDPTEIKFRSSTLEHAMGTARASYHPPGYTGFVPETGKNPRAQQQGLCAEPRASQKDFLLATLFQYPHQLPGYGGYRPQTAINDVGPNRDGSLTTTGRFMESGTNAFEPGDLGLSLKTLAATAPMRSVYGKQGALHKEIFSHESGEGILSDNGRTEADKYYHSTRPYEGRSVAIIRNPLAF